MKIRIAQVKNGRTVNIAVIDEGAIPASWAEQFDEVVELVPGSEAEAHYTLPPMWGDEPAADPAPAEA